MRQLLPISKTKTNGCSKKEFSCNTFLGSVMNSIYIDITITVKIFIRKLKHNLFGRREKRQQCEQAQSTSKIKWKTNLTSLEIMGYAHYLDVCR